MRPSSSPNSWRCHRWGPWPVRQEWVRTCYQRYWRGLAAKCLWKKSHISHHEIIYDKLQYCILVWTDWQWDQEIKQEEGWGPHVLRSQFSWAIRASAIFSIDRQLYMHDFWSGVNLLDPWHPMAMFLNIPQTCETKIALRSRSCPFGQWLYLASTTMRVWTLQQDMQTSCDNLAKTFAFTEGYWTESDFGLLRCEGYLPMFWNLFLQNQTGRNKPCFSKLKMGQL